MSKFYIYGGGKWRLVDLDHGRVDGWGKARFVYYRRKKLLKAKTKSVLAALRYLAAKKKSAAKDGPPLPQKKIWSSINRTSKENECWNGAHCCHHINKNGYTIQKPEQINTITQTIHKADVGIQTSQTLLQENVLKTVPTNVDVIKSLSSPSTNKINLSLKRKRLNSDKNVNRPVKKKVPSIKLQKNVIQKSSEVWTVVDSENNSQKSAEPKRSQSDEKSPRKTVDNSKNTLQSQKKYQKKNHDDQCKELIIDDKDVDIYFKYLVKTNEKFDPLRFELDDDYKRIFFFQINPLVALTRCPRIAQMLKKQEDTSLKEFITNLGLQSVAETSNNKAESVNKRKTRLKRKVETHNSSSNSESESEQKTTKLKTKKASNMLKELNENESQSDSTDELADIVKYLERRKKNKSITKASTPKSKTNSLSKSQESEKLVFVNKQKENVPKSNINKAPEKVLPTLEKRKEKIVQKTDIAKEKVLQKSDVVRPEIMDNSRSSHTISLKPSAPFSREYSNLEDHAIVSFISVSDRAKYVNGNRVWIELAEQFERLAGKRRSFQSLRNRYLRYILPSLGLLALPPSVVARLRAAAATGGKGSRRNSIFESPTLGAHSRRPGVLKKSSDDDTTSSHKPETPNKTRPARSPMRKSPRYSEITRKFAEKHHGDSTSTNTPHSSPTRVKTTIKSQNNPKNKLDTSLNRKKSLNSSQKSLNGSRKSLASKSRERNSLDSSDSDSSEDISQVKRKSLRNKVKTPPREIRGRKLYNPTALL